MQKITALKDLSTLPRFHNILVILATEACSKKGSKIFSMLM